jgi:hypothetical protein
LFKWSKRLSQVGLSKEGITKEAEVFVINERFNEIGRFRLSR